MRITFVDVYPHTFGGAQRVHLMLALELLRRGEQVHVLETGRGRFTEELEAHGVPAGRIELPPALRRYGGSTAGGRAVRAALALPGHWWRLARRLRATTDVVHVGSQRGILVIGPAARLARVGLVWHVHGWRPPQALNVLGRLIAHRTVAVTEDVAAELPRVPRRPAPTVVPNAVDDRYFAVEPAPVSPPYLLTAARLDPNKGIDVLLRALQRVRATRPEVRAVIAGEATEGHEAYAESLRALRDELGLADAVELAGFVGDLRPLLAGATLYVQPSRREGFGLAVVEAMAAGLPVVVSDVDITRLVADGRTGVRVPPDDPQALADAVLALLDDPDRARILAAAGRDAAREHATVAVAADRLGPVYEAVTAGRRHR